MMLVEASVDHVVPLAASMRDADRLEVGAFGRSPDDALRNSLASSLWALTAMVDDKPEAMIGVSPANMIEGLGVPWMLGSEMIYDHARDLVQYGPGIIAEMEKTFPRLENFVSADNERSIRFLRHWNWEVSERQTTIGGIAFVRFSNRV